MSQTLRELEERALGLPIESRAKLAKQLLLSLEEPGADENERIWAEEAQNRLNGIKQGRTQTIPAEEVLQEARERLR